MKTTVIGSEKINKVDNKAQNGTAGKINNLPVSTSFNAPAKKDETKKDEPANEAPQAITATAPEQPTAKVEPPKAEETKPQVEEPKQEPKAEPTKAEVKAAIKPVLNLESTLKLVEEMHRKSKQRTKLQETIKNLEGFEVELRDEADTTDTNYYTGCVLVIEDDKRNKFETKNPTIIWAVAQMVNSMCVDKLAEIEASIVLPQ
ncbi:MULTISPECIES: hypothetical protein [Mucilaginibacter]|uniref:Uncharacterized protein n=1 Tax=Mucilaginibacter rubeus TaxID=2027860 RepID=A0ABX7U5Y5_9SPHI|nr:MULTISPECIES: hypothetical protein [Mucilaginibacter]QTE41570.1 hypothetical protein J3L19_21825 [Mucilaginibacter rubeus]QTE48176.1 hypothetical protein J3L21_21825 [Mucilaginibacter rubeus]QTE59566.1 hypothetical protein J3L23_13465 [Mucilaginibacter rubeus]QTE60973.1 hypothetical protein J3L22_20380 [Mucilaginibacter rubeus]QTF59735.1 hypothetical protein J3L20_20035 [Mucilaginibacter rubeus]